MKDCERRTAEDTAIASVLFVMLLLSGCTKVVADPHPDVPRFPRFRGDPRVEIVSMAQAGERLDEVLHDGDATLFTLSRPDVPDETISPAIVRIYRAGELVFTERFDLPFATCTFGASRAPGGTFEIWCSRTFRPYAVSNWFYVLCIAPPYTRVVVEPGMRRVDTPPPPEERLRTDDERAQAEALMDEAYLREREHPTFAPHTYVHTDAHTGARVEEFDVATIDWSITRGLWIRYYEMHYFRATIGEHVIAYKTDERRFYEELRLVGPLPGDPGIWLVHSDPDRHIPMTLHRMRPRAE